MKDLRSGLDAWRYITASESGRNTIENLLPLILSVSGALGVFPFMVMRYINGEWLAATVDTIIITGFLGLGYYVYRTRRVRRASIAIVCLCIAGALSMIYITGPQQVYWIYPTLMAVFYLLRPPQAIALTLATVAALVPILSSNSDPQTVATIVVTIFVMSSFAFAFSLISNRQRQQLERLATKDPLTGAGNRRHMDSSLGDVVNGHNRNGVSASIVLLDLDHFKKVNDVHGHAVGDQILKRITEIVNSRIRITDSLYRIGGEEFVIVLEGQNIQRAGHLGEELRSMVETSQLVPNQTVTISLGVAELKNDESADQWLQRADEALYRAKRAGRNAIDLAS